MNEKIYCLNDARITPNVLVLKNINQMSGLIRLSVQFSKKFEESPLIEYPPKILSSELSNVLTLLNVVTHS